MTTKKDMKTIIISNLLWFIAYLTGMAVMKTDDIALDWIMIIIGMLAFHAIFAINQYFED